VTIENAATVIKPKQRKLNELLPQINLENITINNVNHLKELLINLKLPVDNFSHLSQ